MTEDKLPTMNEAAEVAEKELTPEKTKKETKKETKTDKKVEKPDEGKKVAIDDKNIKKSVEKEGKVSEKTKPSTDSKTKDQPPVKTEESPDSFATSFNPKDLPEELQTAYKQMHGDYTRKTQELARQRGEYEKVQRYLPLLNKVLTTPELLKQAVGINPETGKTKTPEEEIPTDPKEFAKYVSEQTANKIRTEIAEREKIRAEQEANMKVFQEAERLDPRLNDDKNFQNIIIGMVTQNPDFTSRKINAIEATKQAIDLYDRHIANLLKTKDDERKAAIQKKKHVIEEGKTGGKTTPQEKPLTDMQEIARTEGFIK